MEAYFVDALGRKWKGPYVYIDLFHPERLGLRYQGQDDQMHTPFMVGRSMFGSIERLIAILIEQNIGSLPLWLAPEQVRVIPINDKLADYAVQVHAALEQAGFRVGADYRKENLGAKVHSAENERVPYIIVLGDKEEKTKAMTLRRYGQHEVQEGILLKDLIELLNTEIGNTEKRT